MQYGISMLCQVDKISKNGFHYNGLRLINSAGRYGAFLGPSDMRHFLNSTGQYEHFLNSTRRRFLNVRTAHQNFN